MKIRMTDDNDGTVLFEGELWEVMRDNAHDPVTISELERLCRGETDVVITGYQVMQRVQRIDLDSEGAEIPPDRTLCQCGFCQRIFADPHDGKCPYCFERYIKLAKGAVTVLA